MAVRSSSHANSAGISIKLDLAVSCTYSAPTKRMPALLSEMVVAVTARSIKFRMGSRDGDHDARVDPQ